MESVQISTVVFYLSFWSQYFIRIDAECSPFTYGRDCKYRCSPFCWKGRCYGKHGLCENGCVAGFRGGLCDIVCAKGSYGEGCQKRCSKNCEGLGRCDHVTGFCLDGCKPGYSGFKCQTIGRDRASWDVFVKLEFLYAIILVAFFLITLLNIKLLIKYEAARDFRPIEVRVGAIEEQTFSSHRTQTTRTEYGVSRVDSGDNDDDDDDDDDDNDNDNETYATSIDY